MALDINGYNDTFRAFANFAAQSVGAGKSKAVARADNAGAAGLENRTITAAKHDWVGIGVGRLHSLKVANDTARDLFRKAIADMFGGERNIPQSVRDAMKLADYGKGKPLTARRILAVKAAIDADGMMKDLASLKPETVEIATGKGYVKSELPKLARAAKFLAGATGKSELEAMEEVSTPGSKANRLMNYGGRFMENAENFKEGLRLLDLFKSWHDDISAVVAGIRKNGSTSKGYDYSPADTPSKLNADICLDEKSRLAVEKFAFEEIANKPSVDLKEQDGEKIFGVKNNNASRFFVQGFGRACTSTIVNIPPARREVVFKVFNLFCSMAGKPEDHKIPPRNRFFDVGHRATMLARVLRHFDKIAAMDANGTLTAENVIKTCCPDMVKAGKTGNWDITAVTEFLDDLDAELRRDPDEGGQYDDLNPGVVGTLLGTTGGTLKEVAAMLRGGKRLPNAQYVSEGQARLEDIGTVDGARKSLDTDLGRYSEYGSTNGGKYNLGGNAGFGFTFPGAERFVTNGTQEGKANIEKVGDEVVKMCGDVHPRQSASVMTMLSQSGLGALRGGLLQYGITSDEHSPVDFTLSRNAETGDVTIKYSSPDGLPFHFEWTATVDVDGKVTTTPLTFKNPVEIMKQLGFSGKGGEAIVKVCVHDKALLTSENPAAEFKRRMNANCRDIMMQNSIDIVCQVSGNKVRRDAETPSEAFLKDFKRGAEVTIDGVKYRAPKNGTDQEKEEAFKNVCNAFVRLITGDKAATFATASKAVKLQANVLMGYANQATDGLVMSSAGIAFGAKRTDSLFSAIGRGPRVQSYVFSKNGNGDIRFGYELRMKNIMFDMVKADKRNVTKIDPGASAKYAFSATIPMGKFNRFANADWNGLSDEKVLELKKIERDREDGWIDKLANGIPDPYRLEMEDVDTSFSVEAKNLQDLG